MSFAPIDDDVIDKKPDQKKKAALCKPWFNWWNTSVAVSLGPVMLISGLDTVQREDTPHASKDIAETVAHELIEDHNANCGCNTDLADYYLGAYEEGKSPSQ